MTVTNKIRYHATLLSILKMSMFFCSQACYLADSHQWNFYNDTHFGSRSKSWF